MQRKPDKSGLKRLGRALHSRGPRTPDPPQNISGTPGKHSARGFAQPPCALLVAQRAPRGDLWARSDGRRVGLWVCAVRPCVPGFAIFHSLLFLPKPLLVISGRLFAAPCALLGPSQLRAKAVASSACTTLLPYHSFSSPPPFRPRAPETRLERGAGGV